MHLADGIDNLKVRSEFCKFWNAWYQHLGAISYVDIYDDSILKYIHVSRSGALNLPLARLWLLINWGWCWFQEARIRICRNLRQNLTHISILKLFNEDWMMSNRSVLIRINAVIVSEVNLWLPYTVRGYLSQHADSFITPWKFCHIDRLFSSLALPLPPNATSRFL